MWNQQPWRPKRTPVRPARRPPTPARLVRTDRARATQCREGERRAEAGKPKKGGNPAITAYTVLYNSVLAVGWAYVLYLAVDELLANNYKWDHVYARVAGPLKIFQTAAVLEVLHAILGAGTRPRQRRCHGARAHIAGRHTRGRAPLGNGPGIVPSSVPTTAIQVASRVIILWGIAVSFPQVRLRQAAATAAALAPWLTWSHRARSAPPPHAAAQVQGHWSFTTMVISWAITEVIRYGYYVFSKLNAVPYILLWLR